MTNREYWTGKVEDEVLQPGAMALVDGKPILCTDETVECKNCEIGEGDCAMKAYEWLSAEYTGPDAPPQTRLDWLRHASVEDAAAFILDSSNSTDEGGSCKNYMKCFRKGAEREDCIKCVVEWLNEPMEGNNGNH